MRIYLPSTFFGLAAVLDAGEIGGPPLTAYAVTARLAGPDTAEDDEELEYEALSGAAAASLRLLREEDPSAPRRRAVLAAEAPDAIIGPPPTGTDHPAAVTVTGTVPRKRIAAVHVDAPEAEEAVAAAIAGPDAGTGSEGDPLEEHELLWYATQELPDLLGRT